MGFISRKLFLSVVLLLFVLNPYSQFGPLGAIVLTGFIFYFFIRCRRVDLELVLILFSLVIISMIGVFSSFVHDIPQFVHLKVAVSLAMYVLFAHGLFVFLLRNGLSFNDVVYCALLISVLNCLIIIFEVFFPSFRQIVESFLAPSGNIDWTEGYRYRGVASGGGASLSLLIPVSVVLCLYLYSEKFISVLGVIFYTFILIFAVFFIGRTGLVLLPLVIFLYVIFNLKRYFIKTLFGSLLIVFLFVIYFDDLRQILIGQYGTGFYEYSLGFLMSGAGGIEGEGTVGIIIEFLSVMPKSFPEVLTGYGFYGGSEFVPWTDSGYSRMFLSVGYLFGLLFYMLFFLMFRNVLFSKPFLFLTIGSLLLIAEAKEPLLFTGYSARLYILILVLALLEKKMVKERVHRAKQTTVESLSAKVNS